MYSDLTSVLSRVGKPLEQQLHPDGSRLLLLPHGARILELLAPASDENFFWTHPATRLRLGRGRRLNERGDRGQPQ